MATKAEGLYAALQPRRVALPGGGKAIAVKVGPEKLDEITATLFDLWMVVSAVLNARFCNNLVHFETIFIVNPGDSVVNTSRPGGPFNSKC